MKTIITEYLDELDVPYKIKHHAKPVFTSEEAAKERGVRVSQIIKTMLLMDRDEVVVAVLPAHKRLDVKKLKKLSGHKNLQFMDRESIEKKTGLVVGAIAPVGKILESLARFVDPSVFEEEFVDISSGDPTAGLELSRSDLKQLLKDATITEIIQRA
jgi:Cys-tRNA(Pro)/Cys-tRNA(Cys) deacylase